MSKSNATKNVTAISGAGDQNEAPIQIQAVRETIAELEELFEKSRNAKDALRAAIEKTAERSGLRKAVLSAFVKARCNDRIDEYQTKAEQLSLLFEEV